MNNKDNNSKGVNSNMAIKGGDSKPVEVVFNDKYAHIEPVIAKPLEVKVVGNFDRALTAFRAIVQKEKILSTYKEKQAYEKPSDKRRRKRNEKSRKLLELESKENRFEVE